MAFACCCLTGMVQGLCHPAPMLRLLGKAAGASKGAGGRRAAALSSFDKVSLVLGAPGSCREGLGATGGAGRGNPARDQAASPGACAHLRTGAGLRMGIRAGSAGWCVRFCTGCFFGRAAAASQPGWRKAAALLKARMQKLLSKARQGTNPGSLMSLSSIIWSEMCLGVTSGQGLWVNKLSSGVAASRAGSCGQQRCNGARRAALMPSDTRGGLHCKDVPIMLQIIQIALCPEVCSSLRLASVILWLSSYALRCLDATRLRCGCELGTALPSSLRAPGRRAMRGPGSLGHPGFAGGGCLATVLPGCHPLLCWRGLSVCPLRVGVGSPFAAPTSTAPFPSGPPISPHAGSLLQGCRQMFHLP